MNVVEMNKPSVTIGRKGENDSVKLVFDIADYQSQYPSASFIMMCRRPNDENAYPVPSNQITIQEGKLTWLLSDADLEYNGTGQCELIVMEDEVVAKDVIYSIMILDSLDGGANPPDPWTGWVEQVAASAEQAEQSAQQAASAVSQVEHIVQTYGLKPVLITGNKYKMGFEEVENNG